MIVTHGTPERYRATYAAQLDRLLERYDPLDPADLEEALRPCAPRRRRPWVAFTFDDALLGNYTVAAEELERRGARGIFSVPVDFPAVAPAEQPAWFRAHVRAEPDAEHASDDDMRAMSWEQVRDLAGRGHAIACHTASHLRIDAATPEERLVPELVDARDRLQELSGARIDGLCWPVVFDPTAARARELARATYRWTLITDTAPVRPGHDLQAIHRTRIESSWPVEAVDFQVSGAIDAAFVVYGLRARLKAGHA